MVKRIYIVIAFILLSFGAMGQSLVSYVTVNNTNPYIGQPVQVKVHVFTTTWFTAGVDVGNIQADNALTVYFRSVSTSKTINGKRYSGVELYYNLFPTQEGEITIPSLEIHVESPAEGGYKGIKRTLKTKLKTLTAKGVPLGYDSQKWLVSSSMSVNQKWSMPLKNIKVGDVLERTINRYAGGTLSEFIPATVWDSIPGVSQYPGRPKVATNKTRTSISATRTETVSYLFEKEGEVVIPTLSYMYWNSGTKKFYAKQLDSVTITVQPNADLAMLASIKNSLQQKVEEAAIEDTPFLILGLEPRIFIKYVIIGLVSLFLLGYFSIFAIRFLHKRRSSYLESEKNAFSQVLKAISKNNYGDYSTLSRRWLFKLESPYPTVGQLVNAYGEDWLIREFKDANEQLFKTQHKVADNKSTTIKKGLKQVRKKYLKAKKQKQTYTTQDWLNPRQL